ncbi:M48 family metallopeptidase [Flavobacterium sp.]|uniref:M48 family metallopeptidase n=1 Tax=Flavobacterium sp. TaxID=239 RepID=UPI00286E3A1A|nr:M48 family metallopeptidase [Flavobacterium sp.]
MKKIVCFLSISALVLIESCSTNPFTGKKTLALVSNDQLFPQAFQQYGQFLSENKVVLGTAEAKRVEKVGMKIKAAAERWLTANGKASVLQGYQWEYKLVDNKEVNAWCMPGGKIVFYTGILPITNDEATMAAVMGHEVAHALADHGAQRMSAGMLQQLGGVAVAVGTQNQTPEKQAMWNQAFGIGSQVGVMLPFSRDHESEADMIGLNLMAIAGYDPKNAVTVWERMSAKGGQAPPEFMSTHPSNETRIAKITSQIPAAKAEAAKFGVVFK